MKSTLKSKLDNQVKKRNTALELLPSASPDPIWIAKRHSEEYSALVCALLAYGNARAIVNYLEQLNFAHLNAGSEAVLQREIYRPYRFQSSEDIRQLFISLWRLKRKTSLNALFLKGYASQKSVVEGVRAVLSALYEVNPYRSSGYAFLLGKPFAEVPKSPLKRWMMYLRWMVRRDAIDLGLWQGVAPRDLIIPLDTHTHNIGMHLGLLKRKSYDFKAALELTEALRVFSPDDPVKYDFALFRLGQEKIQLG
jgi:uncharacterized protein (TIGR02757 family)